MPTEQVHGTDSHADSSPVVRKRAHILSYYTGCTIGVSEFSDQLGTFSAVPDAVHDAMFMTAQHHQDSHMYSSCTTQHCISVMIN